MRKYNLFLKTCPLFVLAAWAYGQAAPVSSADRTFMKEVATLDMTGAHEGQMAENQASRADVKDFGHMVAQDNGQSYGELLQVAAKTGVSIPNGINTAHIPAVRGLEPLKGAQFDRQFSRTEISTAQQELALLKREARYGKNPDVKAYANKMIPVAQNDLKRAEECSRPPKRS